MVSFIKGEASIILKTSWKIFHCGTIGRMHAKTWQGRGASSGPSLHSELSYVWMPPGSTLLLQHSRTNMKLLSRSRHKIKYIVQMSCPQDSTCYNHWDILDLIASKASLRMWRCLLGRLGPACLNHGLCSDQLGEGIHTACSQKTPPD